MIQIRNKKIPFILFIISLLLVSPFPITATVLTIDSRDYITGYALDSDNVYANTETGGYAQSTSGSLLYVGQLYYSSDYDRYRTFLCFDTSDLPTGAIIDALSVFIYVTYDYSATDFDINVVEWTSEDSFNNSDYDLYETTVFGTLSTSGLSTGTTYEIVLSSDAYDTIDDDGYSGFALLSSRDLANTTPTGNEYVVIASSMSSTHCPELEVTYHVNNEPSAPTTLYCEGQITPATNILDTTPEFSGIYNDDDATNTASYYEIEVGTDADWTTAEKWDSGWVSISSTVNEGDRCPDVSYGGTTLQGSTTYYWRLRFKDNEDGEGEWSATNSFTMSSSIGNTPPNTPTITSPVTGTTTTDTTPTFTWSYYDANSDVQVYYNIKVLDSLSVTEWDSGTVTSSTASATVPIGYALDGGETYTVQVRVSDGTDWSSWSTGTYTIYVNTAPDTPVLSLPSDGDTTVGLTPTLTWSVFSDDDSGDTQSAIRIQICESDAFVTNYYDTWEVAVTTNSYDITELVNLQYETQYYWRVKVKDSAGSWSDWASEFDFTTIAIGSSPPTFNNAYKVYDSSVTPSSLTLTSETEFSSGEYTSISAEDESVVTSTGTTNYYGMKFKYTTSESEGDVNRIRFYWVGSSYDENSLKYLLWDDTNSEWDLIRTLDGDETSFTFDYTSSLSNYIDSSGVIYCLLLSGTNTGTNGLTADYVSMTICTVSDPCKSLSQSSTTNVSGNYGDAITFYAEYQTIDEVDITSASAILSIDVYDENVDGDTTHEYNNNDGIYYNMSVPYDVGNTRYQKVISTLPEGTYQLRWTFVDTTYETETVYGTVEVGNKLKMGSPFSINKIILDTDETFTASFKLTDYTLNLIAGATVTVNLIDNLGNGHAVGVTDQSNGYYTFALDLSTLSLSNTAYGTWTIEINASKTGYADMDENTDYTIQVKDISLSCSVFDSGGNLITVVETNQTITITGSAVYVADTSPVVGETVTVTISDPDGSVVAIKTATTNSSGNYSTTHTFTGQGITEGTYTLLAEIEDDDRISDDANRDLSVVQVYDINLTNFTSSPSVAGSKTDVTFYITAISESQTNVVFADTVITNPAGDVIFQNTTDSESVTTSESTLFTLGVWDTAQNPSNTYYVSVSFKLDGTTTVVASYSTTYTLQQDEDAEIISIYTEDSENIDTIYFLDTDTLTPKVKVWNNGNIISSYVVVCTLQGEDSESKSVSSLAVDGTTTVETFTGIALTGLSGSYSMTVTVQSTDGDVYDTLIRTINVASSKIVDINSISLNDTTFYSEENVYVLFELENTSVSNISGTLSITVVDAEDTLIATIYSGTEQILGSDTLTQSDLLDSERRWAVPESQDVGDYKIKVQYYYSSQYTVGFESFIVENKHSFEISDLTFTPSQNTDTCSDGYVLIRTTSHAVTGEIENNSNEDEIVEVSILLQQSSVTLKSKTYYTSITAGSHSDIDVDFQIPDSYAGGSYSYVVNVSRILDVDSDESYVYDPSSPVYATDTWAFTLESISLGSISSASYSDSVNTLTISNPSTLYVIDGYVSFEVKRENPDGTLATIHTQTESFLGVPKSGTKILSFVWDDRLYSGTYYIVATLYNNLNMYSDISYYTLPFEGTVVIETGAYTKCTCTVGQGLPYEKTVTVTNTSNVIITDYELNVSLRESSNTCKAYVLDDNNVRTEVTITKSGAIGTIDIDSIDVGTENAIQYIVQSIDSGVRIDQDLTLLDEQYFDSLSRQCKVWQISFANQNLDETCVCVWNVPSGCVEIRQQRADGNVLTITSDNTVTFDVHAGGTLDLYIYKLSSSSSTTESDDSGISLGIDTDVLRYVLLAILFIVVVYLLYKFNKRTPVRKSTNSEKYLKKSRESKGKLKIPKIQLWGDDRDEEDEI